MSLAFPFTGVARSFLNNWHSVRRSLSETASMIKYDARATRSWDFFIVAALGERLFGRRQDAVDARHSTLRGFAERAVWLTHSINDPHRVRAAKEELLGDGIYGITVEELDQYLSEHLDELLNTIEGPQRDQMLADMRQQQTSLTNDI